MVSYALQTFSSFLQMYYIAVVLHITL